MRALFCAAAAALTLGAGAEAQNRGADSDRMRVPQPLGGFISINTGIVRDGEASNPRARFDMVVRCDRIQSAGNRAHVYGLEELRVEIILNGDTQRRSRNYQIRDLDRHFCSFKGNGVVNGQYRLRETLNLRDLFNGVDLGASVSEGRDTDIRVRINITPRFTESNNGPQTARAMMSETLVVRGSL